MDSDSVSAIITNYNNAPTIGRAIRSVREQTHQDWELIVVDDASKDESIRVIQAALDGETRARLEVMPTNSGGPGKPRNHAVTIARGRWVAFLDADDVWHPRKLELQLAAARKTDARFVSTRRLSFRKDDEIRFDEKLAPTDTVLAGARLDHVQLARKNFLCTSSVLGWRELFLAHPFHPDLRYRAIEDYWCWLHVHRDGIPWSWLMRTPLVHYRLAETSISRSRAEMIRKHWMLYGDYFSGQPWAVLRRCLSMGTYAGYSIARLASERWLGVR
ncbi:MAG: glycosyltransferase family 2 protein [Limisphaerales bacterium]